MCCRVVIAYQSFPGLKEFMEELKFRPEQSAGWIKEIPEEHGFVIAKRTEEGLSLNLSPSVSNYIGHTGKRLSASLMFQTAALIGEKTGATISQQATVDLCVSESSSSHPIAAYPWSPLLYDKICRGFREVLLPPQIHPNHDPQS